MTGPSVASQPRPEGGSIPRALADLVARLARIGADAADPPELALRKATLVLASATISILSFAWVGVYLALGLPLAAAIPATYQVASLAGLVALARTRRFAPFRFSQIGLMTALPFLLQWTVGGYVASSAVSLWALVSVLGSIMFFGPLAAIPWFGAFLGLTGISVAIEPLLAPTAAAVPVVIRTAFFGFTIGGVAMTAFLIVRHFVQERERAIVALDAEHARSERLLLNVLPAAIAARLKESPEVIAEAHPDVAVLFADVVDFTPFAEQAGPAAVVAFLDRVFSAFDRHAGELGLEKIKTIGDAYMVVAGVPEARSDPVGAIAEMALRMCDEAARLRASGLPVRLRIGIDCGPVIAGVIGRQKFAYDLWGDVVNTASRMESHGLPDRIQVTPAVAAALGDRFELESRGPISIKGKGDIATAFLVGRRRA